MADQSTVQQDMALSRIAEAVRSRFGDRLERLVLYGSRARGDARPDSDHDLAIFVHDLGSRWEDGMALAEVELELLDRFGVEVVTLLFPAGSWREVGPPLMREIRQEGIDL